MYFIEPCYQTSAQTIASLQAGLEACVNDPSAVLSVAPVGKCKQWDVSSLEGARVLLVVRLAANKAHVSAFPLPLTHLRTTPCPECFDRRLQSSLTVGEQGALQRGFEHEGSDSPYLLPDVAERLQLLARSVLERVGASSARHQVYTLHFISQQVTVSELLIDSFCSKCPAEQTVTETDAVLNLRDHLQAESGKNRMKSLLEYDLPMRALINEVCGATCLCEVTGFAQSVTAPIYGQYAQRAFSAPPRTVGWSGMCTRTDESRLAGVLEALERQGGMLAHPDRIVAFDSYENLKSQAVDPALCFAYNDAAYEHNSELTRYRPDLKIAWQWGYSLFAAAPVLVPKQLVYYDKIPASETKLTENNSSGCALGSCYEEAALRALLELIERDSFVISWFRQAAFPRIDTATCRDRKTRHLLDRVELLGYDMSLLDGRLDLQIPVVIAIGRRRDRDIGAMVVGASANTDSTDAVRGALLEAATSIVETPSLLRAQEQHIREIAENYHDVQSVSDHALLYGLPHMADKARWFDANPTTRSFNDAYPANNNCWHSKGDIGADLRHCVAELQRCKVSDCIVVDVSTREQKLLGLCTVRVIAPGIAPLDFGHPRNRVERLPRFWSTPEMAGLKPAGHDRINPLPHAFP